MSVTLPSSPAPTRCEWKAISIADLNKNPFSGSQQSVDWGGRILTCAVTMPVMGRRDGEAWVSRLLESNNGLVPVLFGDPLTETPMGAWGGTPAIDGAHAAGVTSISLTGLPTTQTDTAVAGDWIAIDNKLYKVLNDADSDGSGDMEIDVWPEVRAGGLTGSETLVITNAKGLFRLADDGTTWTQSGKKFYAIAFNLMEYIIE